MPQDSPQTVAEVLMWIMGIGVVPLVSGMAIWIRQLFKDNVSSIEKRIDDYKEVVRQYNDAVQLVKASFELQKGQGTEANEFRRRTSEFITSSEMWQQASLSKLEMIERDMRVAVQRRGGGGDHINMGSIALILSALLMFSGCAPSTVTFLAPPEGSSVNISPSVLKALREAPLLPIPIIDTTRVPFALRIPPGAIVSPPETIMVFLEAPRVDSDKAFPLLQATVDSSRVKLFGADRDCVYTAPAYGETLTIVVDSSGCRGFVTGHPVQREIEIPRSILEEDKGFFESVGDIVNKIIFAILLILGVAVVLQLIRMFRR